MSGDLAADLIDPWRRPAQLVVYAAAGADLTRAGLVAASPEQATALLVVAEDPAVTLHPAGDPQPRGSAGPPVRFADGLQVLYDLNGAPGPDAAEAAAHWRIRLKRQAAQ